MAYGRIKILPKNKKDKTKAKLVESVLNTPEVRNMVEEEVVEEIKEKIFFNPQPKKGKKK